MHIYDINKGGRGDGEEGKGTRDGGGRKGKREGMRERGGKGKAT